MSESLSYSERNATAIQDALDKGYVGVRFGQGSLLVDADLNEQDGIRQNELQSFLRTVVGDGIPEGSDAFRVVPGTQPGTVQVLPGSYLLNGKEVRWNMVAQAGSPAPRDAPPRNVVLKLEPPTGSGELFYRCYLRVSEEEVAASSDAGILNFGIETSHRTRRRAEIQTVTSALEADPNKALLATVRVDAEGKITELDITDCRRRLSVAERGLQGPVPVYSDPDEKIGVVAVRVPTGPTWLFWAKPDALDTLYWLVKGEKRSLKLPSGPLSDKASRLGKISLAPVATQSGEVWLFYVYDKTDNGGTKKYISRLRFDANTGGVINETMKWENVEIALNSKCDKHDLTVAIDGLIDKQYIIVVWSDPKINHATYEVNTPAAAPQQKEGAPSVSEDANQVSLATVCNGERKYLVWASDLPGRPGCWQLFACLWGNKATPWISEIMLIAELSGTIQDCSMRAVELGNCLAILFLDNLSDQFLIDPSYVAFRRINYVKSFFYNNSAARDDFQILTCTKPMERFGPSFSCISQGKALVLYYGASGNTSIDQLVLYSSS